MEMKHPANYFAFYSPRVSRLDSSLQLGILDLWNFHLTTHNYVLCPRSPQTWKEMDVWIEILTQARESALAANSKPSSWRCLKSFIQILFKSKICLLWKYILSDDIRGRNPILCPWSSPHQFDYIHPNVGTQWFNFNVKIQFRTLTWYRDQIDLSLITLISQIASQ